MIWLFSGLAFVFKMKTYKYITFLYRKRVFLKVGFSSGGVGGERKL
jgi:hypothetical protein